MSQKYHPNDILNTNSIEFKTRQDMAAMMTNKQNIHPSSLHSPHSNSRQGRPTPLQQHRQHREYTNMVPNDNPDSQQYHEYFTQKKARENFGLPQRQHRPQRQRQQVNGQQVNGQQVNGQQVNGRQVDVNDTNNKGIRNSLRAQKDRIKFEMEKAIQNKQKEFRNPMLNATYARNGSVDARKRNGSVDARKRNGSVDERSFLHERRAPSTKREHFTTPGKILKQNETLNYRNRFESTKVLQLDHSRQFRGEYRKHFEAERAREERLSRQNVAENDPLKTNNYNFATKQALNKQHPTDTVENRFTMPFEEDRYNKPRRTVVNVDSRDRDYSIWPNPNQYRIFLGRKFEHVKSVRLVGSAIPNTEQVIQDDPPEVIQAKQGLVRKCGELLNTANNRLYWINAEDCDQDYSCLIYEIVITPGNYTSESLITEITERATEILRFSNNSPHEFNTSINRQTDVVEIQSLQSQQLQLNPLAVSAGSNVVVVTHNNHGFSVDDPVTITGATGFGGIPSTYLNRNHIVTAVLDENTYTFFVGVNASLTTEGGGANVKSGLEKALKFLFSNLDTVGQVLGFPQQDSSEQINRIINFVDIVPEDLSQLPLLDSDPGTLPARFTTPDHCLTVGDCIVMSDIRTIPNIVGKRVVTKVIDKDRFEIGIPIKQVNNQTIFPNTQQGKSIQSVDPNTTDIVNITEAVEGFVMTSIDHLLSAGDLVYIDNVNGGITNVGQINGIQTVDSVDSSTKFQIFNQIVFANPEIPINSPDALLFKAVSNNVIPIDCITPANNGTICPSVPPISGPSFVYFQNTNTVPDVNGRVFDIIANNTGPFFSAFINEALPGVVRPWQSFELDPTITYPIDIISFKTYVEGLTSTNGFLNIYLGEPDPGVPDPAFSLGAPLISVPVTDWFAPEETGQLHILPTPIEILPGQKYTFEMVQDVFPATWNVRYNIGAYALGTNSFTVITTPAGDFTFEYAISSGIKTVDYFSLSSGKYDLTEKITDVLANNPLANYVESLTSSLVMIERIIPQNNGLITSNITHPGSGNIGTFVANYDRIYIINADSPAEVTPTLNGLRTITDSFTLDEFDTDVVITNAVGPTLPGLLRFAATNDVVTTPIDNVFPQNNGLLVFSGNHALNVGSKVFIQNTNVRRNVNGITFIDNVFSSRVVDTTNVIDYSNIFPIPIVSVESVKTGREIADVNPSPQQVHSLHYTIKPLFSSSGGPGGRPVVKRPLNLETILDSTTSEPSVNNYTFTFSDPASEITVPADATEILTVAQTLDRSTQTLTSTIDPSTGFSTLNPRNNGNASTNFLTAKSFHTRFGQQNIGFAELGTRITQEYGNLASFVMTNVTGTAPADIVANVTPVEAAGSGRLWEFLINSDIPGTDGNIGINGVGMSQGGIIRMHIPIDPDGGGNFGDFVVGDRVYLSCADEWVLPMRIDNIVEETVGSNSIVRLQTPADTRFWHIGEHGEFSTSPVNANIDRGRYLILYNRATDTIHSFQPAYNKNTGGTIAPGYTAFDGQFQVTHFENFNKGNIIFKTVRDSNPVTVAGNTVLKVDGNVGGILGGNIADSDYELSEFFDANVMNDVSGGGASNQFWPFNPMIPFVGNIGSRELAPGGDWWIIGFPGIEKDPTKNILVEKDVYDHAWEVVAVTSVTFNIEIDQLTAGINAVSPGPHVVGFHKVNVNPLNNGKGDGFYDIDYVFEAANATIESTSHGLPPDQGDANIYVGFTITTPDIQGLNVASNLVSDWFTIPEIVTVGEIPSVNGEFVYAEQWGTNGTEFIEAEITDILPATDGGFASTGHGLSAGQQVFLTGTGANGGILNEQIYTVSPLALTPDLFQLNGVVIFPPGIAGNEISTGFYYRALTGTQNITEILPCHNGVFTADSNHGLPLIGNGFVYLANHNVENFQDVILSAARWTFGDPNTEFTTEQIITPQEIDASLGDNKVDKVLTGLYANTTGMEMVLAVDSNIIPVIDIIRDSSGSLFPSPVGNINVGDIIYISSDHPTDPDLNGAQMVDYVDLGGDQFFELANVIITDNGGNIGNLGSNVFFFTATTGTCETINAITEGADPTRLTITGHGYTPIGGMINLFFQNTETNPDINGMHNNVLIVDEDTVEFQPGDTVVFEVINRDNILVDPGSWSKQVLSTNCGFPIFSVDTGNYSGQTIITTEMRTPIKPLVGFEIISSTPQMGGCFIIQTSVPPEYQTSPNLPWSDGDSILIHGMIGGNPYLEGEYPVFQVSGNTFKIQLITSQTLVGNVSGGIGGIATGPNLPAPGHGLETGDKVIFLNTSTTPDINGVFDINNNIILDTVLTVTKLNDTQFTIPIELTEFRNDCPDQQWCTNMVCMEFFNHGLIPGDIFFLYNSGCVGGLLEDDINTVHGEKRQNELTCEEKLTRRTVVRTEGKNVYFEAGNFATARQLGGGFDLCISSQNHNCDEIAAGLRNHGFASVQTNVLCNGALNRVVNLEGEQYLLMISPQLNNMINTGEVRDIFAKIQLVDLPGTLLYNTFVTNEKIFDNPLELFETIDLEFRKHNGKLYQFNGIEHSFTLEIFEYLDRLRNTYVSSKRGIADRGVVSTQGFIESTISAANPAQNIISPLAQLERESLTRAAT